MTLQEELAAAGLPSQGARVLLRGEENNAEALRCYAIDAERIAEVVVRRNLKRLHLLDFGGLVACGTNRVQAEALLLKLLFPDTGSRRGGR